ncbi:MAG: hypothetical protein ACLS61_03680 [Ruminococcus sp.]
MLLYADGVKRERPKIVRIPFSDQEITALIEHPEIPFADMILIGIYSGWRPRGAGSSENCRCGSG